VDTLNVKIGKVLSAQESEFLRVYRSHMYGLDRELKSLREAASQAAASLARDQKVKEVEAARDWYRTEAMRLDGVVTRQKGEVAALQERLRAATQDSVWQNERAREAAKEHNKLAAELEASRVLGAAAAASLGEESMAAVEAAQKAAAAADAAAQAQQQHGSPALVGTGTLSLLSPARRKALQASLGVGGGGEAEEVALVAPPAAQGGAARASEREAALEREVARLRREVEGLRFELEQEREGGGGSAAAGEASRQQQAKRQPLRGAAAVPGPSTPSTARSGTTAGTASTTGSAATASGSSQNLPPGLKPSSLKG
jgi:hypothetical protein